jgi:hypothetical protein
MQHHECQGANVLTNPAIKPVPDHYPEEGSSTEITDPSKPPSLRSSEDPLDTTWPQAWHESRLHTPSQASCRAFKRLILEPQQNQSLKTSGPAHHQWQRESPITTIQLEESCTESA